jgi:hypothetical protein
MKKYNIEIKWAVIFVIMTFVWMLLEKLFGLYTTHIDKHYIYTNFIAIPAIAVYVFALLEKRKRDFGGSMTYWQGLISGLIITAIVTVISPLTQVITNIVIAPEYFPNMMEFAVSSGKMDQVAAEKEFTLGSYIIQGLIGAPVMGVLTSAIVAIFTRRKAK